MSNAQPKEGGNLITPRTFSPDGDKVITESLALFIMWRYLSFLKVSLPSKISKGNDQ